MATGTQVVLVGAAAAVIIARASGHSSDKSVVVDNTGANPASLGGVGVNATGYTINAGQSRSITLATGDPLYAFSTLGTTLQVLTSP